MDLLSDNGFPVSRVAIIGSDVRLVEQVADEARQLLAGMPAHEDTTNSRR